MQLGYRHWGWVSTDTAGVPHGGPFGDVGRFETAAASHGLILGWSQRLNCFGVCTRLGPTKWVCQMLLRNQVTRRPIPCSDSLLAILLIAWERHSRYSADTIEGYLLQLERDRQHALAKESYDFHKDRVMDNVTEVYRARGIDTRPLISIPSRVRKETKWRKRRQAYSGRPRP